MAFGRPSILSLARLTYSRNFNVPEQGLSRGENSRSPRGYHDELQGGTTHTSYGVGHRSMYPQALQSSSLQPGTPAGHDKAPTEFVRMSSVQSADSSYPLGFVRQQSPRQMKLARSSSQGSADAWDPLAGSYSHQSTKSHFPYNPGGFRVDCQQNPRPIAAAPPSQSRTGVHNAWVLFSEVFLNFSLLRQPLTKGNWTTMATKKREALVVCKGQTEYRTRILIPMGIEDWDQLLPSSRPRLQVTILHWGRL
jgi:hypothetical protein